MVTPNGPAEKRRCTAQTHVDYHQCIDRYLFVIFGVQKREPTVHLLSLLKGILIKVITGGKYGSMCVFTSEFHNEKVQTGLTKTNKETKQKNPKKQVRCFSSERYFVCHF